ncbi:MAG: hypothetical protein KJ674_03575 [Nanoarchaeota archaeon]|nr:hypothetical protein [Nanoarchaeota archaeon]
MIFFAKGKRGRVYLEKDKAIKQTNEKRARKEANYLKLFNKYKIGPKFLYLRKDKFAYKFVKGPFILEYIKKNKDVKKILIDVLKQCRTLDKLKINKLEMHNPYKHIIINNKEPIMIDFERCYSTEKPKNVTQFGQYLMSAKVSEVLFQKNIKINKKELIKFLKVYKRNQTDKNFKKIIDYVSQ